MQQAPDTLIGTLGHPVGLRLMVLSVFLASSLDNTCKILAKIQRKTFYEGKIIGAKADYLLGNLRNGFLPM